MDSSLKNNNLLFMC